MNGEQADVGADGKFTHRVLLDPGANVVTVTAKDLAGNETTVTRTVHLDLDSPAITDIAPASDVKLAQGDTLRVSFKSDPGLNASFRIELPIAPAAARAGEIAMTESAATPGLYEGSYKTPDKLIWTAVSSSFGQRMLPAMKPKPSRRANCSSTSIRLGRS